MAKRRVAGDSSALELNLCALISGRFLALPITKVSWEAGDASHGVFVQQQEE